VINYNKKLEKSCQSLVTRTRTVYPTSLDTVKRL